MSKKTVHRLLSVLTLLAVVVGGFKYLDREAMLTAWQSFSWSHIGLCVIFAALYLVAKAFRFLTLMKAVTEVESGPVLKGYSASQAASLLPGGVAFRAATMSQIGHPVEKTAGPILANSAFDQFLLLLTGLTLCYWYPQLRTPAIVLSVILVFLVSSLAHPTSRGAILDKLSRLAAYFNQEEKFERFLRHVQELWGPKTLSRSMAWTVAANTLSLLNLITVVHALDLKVQPWILAAAFVVPNLLGRLSPLPAGAGVTEAGMVAMMASRGAMSINEAAVATAIFRVVDVLLPALYGMVIYYTVWRPSVDTSSSN